MTSDNTNTIERYGESTVKVALIRNSCYACLREYIRRPVFADIINGSHIEMYQLYMLQRKDGILPFLRSQ